MPTAWIYLSAHLDDAVFSCGGLIWEQIQKGHSVTIWTLFAGDAIYPLTPLARELHNRWQLGENAGQIRRGEDIEACRQIGTAAMHSSFHDCIYRRSSLSGAPIIEKNEDLFSPIHPDEFGLCDQIKDVLSRGLPDSTHIVVPLTLGGHMDHRLLRTAAERLDRPLYYYADFPYSIETGADLEQVLHNSIQSIRIPVGEAGLRAWQSGVRAYRSQLSTWWSHPDEADAAIQAYHQAGGGQQLWKKA